ncbi:hypothetical protein GCM10009716_12340 [Streptomyces sodiiphilus]|uniref:ESX-1 secretion-associated protein n=1 Tax=Streptomyces sodiiphilus TaxID=226217 RepID=A0ABN2NXE4_9ACTN
MTGSDEHTGTRLNGIDDGYGGVTPIPGGGSEPDLVIDDAALGAIGEDAHGLRTRVVPEATQPTTSSVRAAGELMTGGMASGRVLQHVAQAFARQAVSLQQDCERIEQHLGYTVSAHAAQEHDIVAHLQQVGAGLLGISPRLLAAAGLTSSADEAGLPAGEEADISRIKGMS